MDELGNNRGRLTAILRTPTSVHNRPPPARRLLISANLGYPQFPPPLLLRLNYLEIDDQKNNAPLVPWGYLGAGPA